MTHSDERVGLAVIFDVNDQKTGTRFSVKKVEKTFRDLNYAIWVVTNTTPSKMKNAAKIISKYRHYSIKYEWIVVYYCGHGGISKDNNKGFFWFHDQKEPIPFENVTEPLQPGYEGNNLANRKRLFLFDCCLTECPEHVKTDPIPTNRDDLPSFIPSHDYTTIAYATYLRDPALAIPSEGGIWTGVLCNNIKKYASLKKVNEILELTRNEVIRETNKLKDKKLQGPHYTSIGGDGYLIDRGTLTHIKSCYYDHIHVHVDALKTLLTCTFIFAIIFYIVTNPPLQDSQLVAHKAPVSGEAEDKSSMLIIKVTCLHILLMLCRSH